MESSTWICSFDENMHFKFDFNEKMHVFFSGKSMFTHQNSRRLLLLCIRIADFSTTTCCKLCKHGPSNDWSYKVIFMYTFLQRRIVIFYSIFTLQREKNGTKRTKFNYKNNSRDNFQTARNCIKKNATTLNTMQTKFHLQSATHRKKMKKNQINKWKLTNVFTAHAESFRI